MSKALDLQTQEHFDHVSGAYYGIVDRVWYDVGYYHRREARFVREHLSPGLGIAVDAGSGPGRHTALLATSCRKVVAVDISRSMLEVARQRLTSEARDRVDLIQADIRYFPLRDCVADAIVNLEVLEHLPRSKEDVPATIREFRRIVRPQGLLMMEAPLLRHRALRTIYPFGPTWKEIPRETIKEIYIKHPLSISSEFLDEQIDHWLRLSGFLLIAKSFVRVLPAGLVERHPRLHLLDRLLESVPIIRRLAREALWAVTPV